MNNFLIRNCEFVIRNYDHCYLLLICTFTTKYHSRHNHIFEYFIPHHQLSKTHSIYRKTECICRKIRRVKWINLFGSNENHQQTLKCAWIVLPKNDQGNLALNEASQYRSPPHYAAEIRHWLPTNYLKLDWKVRSYWAAAEATRFKATWLSSVNSR